MKPENTRGFSLIELMVAVAIVGIIAAFALPTYDYYTLRAGRTEGATVLMEVMERQELQYRNNLRYSANLTDLGYDSNSIESENSRYVVTAGNCSDAPIGRCVALTATAQNSQAGDGNLTLNSRGKKSGNWP